MSPFALAHPLVALTCGKTSGEGLAQSALEQLGRSIQKFSVRAISYLDPVETEDALSFGPFCARVLLENGCAAILGRLDCFRLLYLSEFQSQPHYESGKRAKSSFSWTGDVVPEEKPGELWSMETDLSKISRALFSKHLDHLYWKPAVNKLLDYMAEIQDLRLADMNDLDADLFINQIRGRSMQLYSSLSKGVHWEFFSSSLALDDITVRSDLREAVLLIARLGLVSNFIPTAYGSLAAPEAINNYLDLKVMIS